MPAFDLSEFAPNPVFEFTLPNGKTYRCLSDPDVDQVARMLRIEEAITSVGGEELAAAFAEGKELLKELIRDLDPDADLEKFSIGGQALLTVFAAIVHGESVARAILEKLAADNPAEPPQAASGDPGGLQHDDSDGFAAEGGDVRPLASVRPSPEQSSSSDEHADTRLATGTA